MLNEDRTLEEAIMMLKLVKLDSGTKSSSSSSALLTSANCWLGPGVRMKERDLCVGTTYFLSSKLWITAR